MTVIIVSHHLRLVREVVRSVILVEAGEAVKGTAAEMLSTERLVDAFGVAGGRPS